MNSSVPPFMSALNTQCSTTAMRRRCFLTNSAAQVYMESYTYCSKWPRKVFPKKPVHPNLRKISENAQAETSSLTGETTPNDFRERDQKEENMKNRQTEKGNPQVEKGVVVGESLNGIRPVFTRLLSKKDLFHQVSPTLRAGSSIPP